ncbi:MAG: cytidylate kinase-like family protein [Nitrospirae bacterium]|nr:cytidylate kinase-like family protein [Nitrospirota bacterium]
MAILTISREIGSGGREIGYAVAELLKYELITKEKIFSDIRESGGKWEEWGKVLDEHRPTIWEKYDWSFMGFGALIQSHILNYALQDKVVIMGRGGNFLLKDIPYALRIRVVAPIDKRVERIMRRESVDNETARWLAEKTDKERAGFISALYGKDWNDPVEYDMVFDAGKSPVEEITNTVKNVIQERDKLKTDAAKKILEMKAAAAKVKAGILTDPSFFVPTLDVYYEGQSLILRGVIHKPGEHKRIEDRARHLAGDVPIKCELHYRM